MQYKYISHTADVKFKAFGRNIDAVFSNSALAMFNILGPTNKVKPTKTKKIKVKTKSYEQLLYDFLQGLLFLLDTEHFFLHKVKQIKITKDFELTATVEGDNCNNYELKGDIKAVTYSDMEIKKIKEGYEATVVVDI